MTIMEAVNSVDNLKHNTYSFADKVQWLSRLDGMVKRLIIDTHESRKVFFYGYTEDTEPDTELLVPAPFDAMYLRWLDAQIDYTNGEYDKYNNSILMFNVEWEKYQKYYRSVHKPKRSLERFLF